MYSYYATNAFVVTGKGIASITYILNTCRFRSHISSSKLLEISLVVLFSLVGECDLEANNAPDFHLISCWRNRNGMYRLLASYVRS